MCHVHTCQTWPTTNLKLFKLGRSRETEPRIYPIAFHHTTVSWDDWPARVLITLRHNTFTECLRHAGGGTPAPSPAPHSSMPNPDPMQSFSSAIVRPSGPAPANPESPNTRKHELDYMANSITKIQVASSVQVVHLPSRPIYSPFSTLILCVHHVYTYPVILSDILGIDSSSRPPLPSGLCMARGENSRGWDLFLFISSRTLHQNSGWKYGFVGYSLLSIFNQEWLCQIHSIYI